MVEIPVAPEAFVSLFGQAYRYNPVTLAMTWFTMAVLVIFGLSIRKRLAIIPGFLQSTYELLSEFLSEITLSTLGEKDGKKFLPFMITLFVFVLLANWIGILPNILAFFGSVFALIANLFGSENVSLVAQGITKIQLNVSPGTWYGALMRFPGFEEPTKNVNSDLALAIIVLVLVQFYSIQQKGFKGYLKKFYNDPIPMKGWLGLLFFINPFFYLNIIGMIANTVSHSFRLFGNIFGGSMIILIVSSLLKMMLIPVGLNAFFGLFAGLVQAFVFTMLAVTYIALEKEEG